MDICEGVGDWVIEREAEQIKNYNPGQIFHKGWYYNVNSRQIGNFLEYVAFLNSRKRLACKLLEICLFTRAVVAFGKYLQWGK